MFREYPSWTVFSQIYVDLRCTYTIYDEDAADQTTTAADDDDNDVNDVNENVL